MFSISDVIITQCDMSCAFMYLCNALCNIFIIDDNVYISGSSLPTVRYSLCYTFVGKDAYQWSNDKGHTIRAKWHDISWQTSPVEHL